VNPNIPKVTVLLTTFNGVRFLDEQLTSLFYQQGVDIEVMVNDDGSTDGTIEILEHWRAKGLIVSISQSRALGATRAFLTLLQSCDEKEFVAFCDQDDVWDISKLALQANSLDESTPMMSTCLRLYIDESGEVIGKSKNLRELPSFVNSCFENIAPGNTVLLNNSAIKVINSLQNPPVVHYDSWIYLLISTFGKVDFTPSYFVRYRIHLNNSVGLRKQSFARMRKSLKNYLEQQTFLLDEKYESLSENHRKHLIAISTFVREKNLRKRLSLFPKLKIGRQANRQFF
jgi:glycosyltransferase involved in cell wall biosynthesis